jgi:hypothetical protein
MGTKPKPWNVLGNQRRARILASFVASCNERGLTSKHPTIYTSSRELVVDVRKEYAEALSRNPKANKRLGKRWVVDNFQSSEFVPAHSRKNHPVKYGGDTTLYGAIMSRLRILDEAGFPLEVNEELEAVPKFVGDLIQNLRGEHGADGKSMPFKDCLEELTQTLKGHNGPLPGLTTTPQNLSVQGSLIRPGPQGFDYHAEFTYSNTQQGVVKDIILVRPGEITMTKEMFGQTPKGMNVGTSRFRVDGDRVAIDALTLFPESATSGNQVHPYQIDVGQEGKLPQTKVRVRPFASTDYVALNSREKRRKALKILSQLETVAKWLLPSVHQR